MPVDFRSALTWKVPPGAAATTLELHVAEGLLISTEAAADLIDFGSVQVNGRQERTGARLLIPGDTVQVHWPRGGTVRGYEIDPRRILFQDAVLMAYDKERGVPSQQTPYDAYNNLFEGLRRHLKNIGHRPVYVGLHHRLDRETTGVLVFSLEPRANRKLGRAFEARQVVKEYLAWVGGHPQREAWTREDDIGRKQGRYAAVPKGEGKPAATRFQTLFRGEGSSLVLARPVTGRTHQIRLHLAASGHPILGDRLYGGHPSSLLHLHAHRLKLPHPVSGRQLELTAPIPPDWPEPREAATRAAPHN
jgi:23S rRNA pseudouridine1911/1915/1917 synthase